MAFEYLGYHFAPVGKFPPSATFFDITRRLKSDRSMGCSTYEWATKPYSHKDFYQAANAAGCGDYDKFLCLENGLTYVPCENELFMLTDCGPTNERKGC